MSFTRNRPLDKLVDTRVQELVQACDEAIDLHITLPDCWIPVEIAVDYLMKKVNMSESKIEELLGLPLNDFLKDCGLWEQVDGKLRKMKQGKTLFQVELKSKEDLDNVVVIRAGGKVFFGDFMEVAPSKETEVATIVTLLERHNRNLMMAGREDLVETIQALQRVLAGSLDCMLTLVDNSGFSLIHQLGASDDSSHQVQDEKDLKEEMNADNLEFFFRRLRKGEWKNIVVLTGAGVSTSAGIKDFRSPGGLFEMIKTRWGSRFPQVENTPECLLSRSFVNCYPNVWEEEVLPWLKEWKVEDADPTATHFWTGWLHRMGWLRRVYTQNVDGLHMRPEVGVPSELIVEAHGSFRDGSVVLYGDSLPKRFQDCVDHDFRRRGRGPDIDLLFIFGTALQVAPFNMIPSTASDSCSRVVVNRCLDDITQNYEAWHTDALMVESDCDDFVMRFFSTMHDLGTQVPGLRPNLVVFGAGMEDVNGEYRYNEKEECWKYKDVRLVRLNAEKNCGFFWILTDTSEVYLYGTTAKQPYEGSWEEVGTYGPPPAVSHIKENVRNHSCL